MGDKGSGNETAAVCTEGSRTDNGTATSPSWALGEWWPQQLGGRIQEEEHKLFVCRNRGAGSEDGELGVAVGGLVRTLGFLWSCVVLGCGGSN